jgi:hypothetical protein
VVTWRIDGNLLPDAGVRHEAAEEEAANEER